MSLFSGLFNPRPTVAPVIPLPVVNPKPVLAPPLNSSRVLGIDTSHYEPAVDWIKAKAAGVQWMYTKATEGTGHVDSMLHQHVLEARAAGVLTGVYHFFRASADPVEQANLFLRTVKGLKVDLPYILDWEISDGMSGAVNRSKAKVWLEIVEKADGRTPWVYGGESFLAGMTPDAAFARYFLILAHYGIVQAQLKVPAPWPKAIAWQFTDALSLPGLAPGHHVDANYFLGSLQELKALIAV